MNDREKLRASLLAAAVGDAMGMPFETLGSFAILAGTEGKGPDRMYPAMQTRIDDTRRLVAGTTTDDTEQIGIVCASLIRSRKFDLRDMALAHVEGSQNSKFVWGRTTAAGILDFIRYIEAPGHQSVGGRDLHVPAAAIEDLSSCGTGVAMKVAPLALHHAVRHGKDHERLLEDVIALGRMTHGDLRASYGAYAVASMITKVFHRPIRTPDDAARALKSVIADVRAAEFRYHLLKDYKDTVSGRLTRLNRTFEEKDVCVETVTGSGFGTLESVPLAIGVFLRHYDDFRTALREAILAGGDTDTVASMVGAMHGANGFGIDNEVTAEEAMPGKWYLQLVDEGRTMRALGKYLYASALVCRK